MKKLLLVLSSMLICFTSNGEWIEANGDPVSGDTYYVDFDTMINVDGSFYVWTMVDYSKPDEYGRLSSKAYIEGDCERLRTKLLALISYKQNMGEGVSSQSINPTNPEWRYNPPESIGRDTLRLNCYMAEGLEISPEEFKNRVNSWKEFLLSS